VLDFAALLGTLFGFAALVGGQWLEGGSFSQLLQVTSGIIVLGGTLGAVFLSFPMQELLRAWGQIPRVYRAVELDFSSSIEEIVEIAALSRREGLLVLESRKNSVADPLLRKGLQYVVDGLEPAVIQEVMGAEIDATRGRLESAARVFEAAGGYSPTVGILGAVLGLIQVMSHLDEPSKIGGGIAVAFVATVYGVAFANLLMLPWASKLKRAAEAEAMGKEVVLQGVLGIQEGLNPNFLKERLEIFLDEQVRLAAGKSARGANQ